MIPENTDVRRGYRDRFKAAIAGVLAELKAEGVSEEDRALAYADCAIVMARVAESYIDAHPHLLEVDAR